MTDKSAHLALFDTLDPAAEAISSLQALGLAESDIEIISGTPYTEPMLGRPHVRSFVPFFGMGGALAGFAAGIALNWGTPLLYPVHVGGKPLFPIPPTAVLTFETTMLGLMLFTFLGVFWEAALPAFFSKKTYHAKISDGKVAVVFHCSPQVQPKAYEALIQAGAEHVAPAEALKL